MNNIYNLLNIKQDVFQEFPLLASLVVDHQVDKTLGKQIIRLQHLGEKLTTDGTPNIPQQSIDEVIRKVKRASKKENGLDEIWTNRELRIISYNLMSLHGKPNMYSFALSLLNYKWRDTYLNGIAFCLLSSWNSTENEYLEPLSTLFVTHLNGYNGNNRKFLLWKNHINLFEKSGPMRMAALVKAKGMSLLDAPSVIGFSKVSLGQSYYSDVIVKCVEDNHIEDLNAIREILQIHNLDRTKKLVCACLIEKEEQKGDEVRRGLICNYINFILGDVTLSTTWAPFFGATEKEVVRLKNAKNKVCIWLAKQIIEVFFDECVQDAERRSFWLSYTHCLSGFKIVGSRATHTSLKNNPKIGALISRYFIETNSRTGQTSALVLYVKDKMIIEFTDRGALYVYNSNHETTHWVKKEKVASINELKSPKLQILVNAYAWEFCDDKYNEFGRMPHIGYWQERLHGWMNKYILNDNDNNSRKKEDLEKKYQEIIENADSNIIYERGVLAIISSSYTPYKYDYQRDEMGISHVKRTYKYRIVVNENGYFINNYSEDLYAKIKETSSPAELSGHIDIKPADYWGGWMRIEHYYDGYEHLIGYLKYENDKFIFKVNRLEKESLHIIL